MSKMNIVNAKRLNLYPSRIKEIEKWSKVTVLVQVLTIVETNLGFLH